jgi:protein disulfide-isomerase A1
MGGNPDLVPSIAAMKLNGKANWPYTGELATDKLIAWAQGIADGSVKPHLKSEAVPADTGAGSVRVVVGKTYDDVVIKRGNKDVLLEIYAPWWYVARVSLFPICLTLCANSGHCKTLAPIYDELAAAYADKPDLVIAKIDGAVVWCVVCCVVCMLIAHTPNRHCQRL